MQIPPALPLVSWAANPTPSIEESSLTQDPTDRLLVVLDEMTCLSAGHDPVDLGISLAESGVRRLWYRYKGPQETSRTKQVERLLKNTQPYEIKLTLSAPDTLIVPQVGCGLHLSSHHTPGQKPLGLQAGTPTGQSCHSLEEAVQAFNTGVDYITISPVWSTVSHKTRPRRPLGTAGLALVTQNTSGPVFALGGVTSTRVSDCLQAGAHGVAVLGAICLAPEPIKAAESLIHALGLALKSENLDSHNLLSPHQ